MTCDAIQAGVGVAGVEHQAREVELDVAPGRIVIDGDDGDLDAAALFGGQFLPAGEQRRGGRARRVQQSAEGVDLAHLLVGLAVPRGEMPVEVRAVEAIVVDHARRPVQLQQGEDPGEGGSDAAGADERDVVEVDRGQRRAVGPGHAVIPQRHDAGPRPQLAIVDADGDQHGLGRLHSGEHPGESRGDRVAGGTAEDGADSGAPSAAVDRQGVVDVGTEDEPQDRRVSRAGGEPFHRIKALVGIGERIGKRPVGKAGQRPGAAAGATTCRIGAASSSVAAGSPRAAAEISASGPATPPGSPRWMPASAPASSSGSPKPASQRRVRSNAELMDPRVGDSCQPPPASYIRQPSPGAPAAKPGMTVA